MQLSDDDALSAWVEEVIAANPDAIAKIVAGDAKPLGHLVGEVMRRSRGAANPRRVSELLRAAVEEARDS